MYDFNFDERELIRKSKESQEKLKRIINKDKDIYSDQIKRSDERLKEINKETRKMIEEQKKFYEKFRQRKSQSPLK